MYNFKSSLSFQTSYAFCTYQTMATGSRAHPLYPKNKQNRPFKQGGKQNDYRNVSLGAYSENRYSGGSSWHDTRAPRDINKKKLQGPEGGPSLSMGTSIIQLKRAPECIKGKEKSLDELIHSSGHIFFCNIHSGEVTNEAYTPMKTVRTDYSNENFVCMPYTVHNENSEKQILNHRWERIQNALKPEIGNVYALEKAIKSYSNESMDFNVLRQYFEVIGSEKGCSFFEETLPKIQDLVLQLPNICPGALPFLKQKTNKKITMSQEQVACLLANAFFCTFPDQNFKRKCGRVPEINFGSLYSDYQASHRKIEKLKCIMNYFERVAKKMPSGRVTYSRQSVSVEQDFWFKMNKKLTNLHVSTDGTIEDIGKGMLETDFANKFVGGGVLRNGLVQEEIRFVLCPEMILSRLFTEMLTDKETLTMIGCERFNDYTGYSDTFYFKGNHEDITERDNLERRYTEVVAMDALVFNESYTSQFEKNNLLRELNKAFCAFKGSESDTDLPAVCTGNWGCGAFGGDKQLKALIQMIAASAAGRDVCYLTFGDTELCRKFGNIHQLVKDNNWSISRILSMVQDYGIKICKGKMESLFDYIENRVTDDMKNPRYQQENVHEDHGRGESFHGKRNQGEKVLDSRGKGDSFFENIDQEENKRDRKEKPHENRHQREHGYDSRGKGEDFSGYRDQEENGYEEQDRKEKPHENRHQREHGYDSRGKGEDFCGYKDQEENSYEERDRKEKPHENRHQREHGYDSRGKGDSFSGYKDQEENPHENRHQREHSYDSRGKGDSFSGYKDQEENKQEKRDKKENPHENRNQGESVHEVQGLEENLHEKRNQVGNVHENRERREGFSGGRNQRENVYNNQSRGGSFNRGRNQRENVHEGQDRGGKFRDNKDRNEKSMNASRHSNNSRKKHK